MKSKMFQFTRTSLLLLPLLALALGGCALFSSTNKGNVMEQPDPKQDQVARLHVGDTITITLTGPPEELTPQEKPIKEDGTITLPDIGRVKAAGKTPGELEDAIHRRYVPAIYTHLNVTVRTTSDQVYFVRGEVRQPGRLIYVGPITVTKAITSAGDFTDFANRRNVVLIRSSGQRFKLNCVQILNGDAPDPPVFPGDQIEVRRRYW